jgi:hypothetical protein
VSADPSSTAPSDERDLWDRIGEMRWQHFLLIVIAVAAFVALSFAPACSIRISSSPSSTTTTEVSDGVE